MEPCFIDGDRGRLFAVYHDAGPNTPDAILYLPPFAEENNRARHVAAAFARRCAADGIAVLLLDPYGTGDSDGEFGNADWTGWIADARRAIGWLRQRGHSRISLMGLRAGGLLAAGACNEKIHKLIFWAPVAKGDLFLRQFLRLRVAANLTGADSETENVKDLLARLGQGDALEVAGYTLSPSMAQELSESALIAAPPPASVDVLWLDTAAEATEGLPPASEECAGAWRKVGVNVTGRRVAGPSFWQQIEPEHCPALAEATLEWLQAAGCGQGSADG